MSNNFEKIVEEIVEEVENATWNWFYNFPTPNDFEDNGIFSHIELPIPEDEDIPEEIYNYILGENYQILLTLEIDKQIMIVKIIK